MCSTQYLCFEDASSLLVFFSVLVLVTACGYIYYLQVSVSFMPVLEHVCKKQMHFMLYKLYTDVSRIHPWNNKSEVFRLFSQSNMTEVLLLEVKCVVFIVLVKNYCTGFTVFPGRRLLLL